MHSKIKNIQKSYNLKNQESTEKICMYCKGNNRNQIYLGPKKKYKKKARKTCET